MHIRSYRPGEEEALHALFLFSVHGLAGQDYTPEQIEAWTSAAIDPVIWAGRIQSIQPFVVEQGGAILAYADVQPNGYINHFFVSPGHARQGVATRLMAHLHEVAAARAIPVLSADVSRTAQPFFEHSGFVVVEQRLPVLRGVAIPNALMRKALG